MANNAPQNPLAAPLTGLKQMGLQSVQSVNALGTSLINSLNQGLDVLITGVPALPALPGGQAIQGPTPQALMPGNLTQALANIENVLIPPGLPRPSQALAAKPGTPAAPAPAAAPAAQAVTGRRKITELGGY